MTAGVAGKIRSIASRWATVAAAAVFLTVVATCLSGCATHPTPTASGAPPLLARGYPSTTQDPVVVARFPARVAGFEREDVTEYESSGRDASAQYQFLRGDFVVSATFYRYPAHEEFPTLDEIYDVTREQVLGYHDSTRLLNEEETAITRGDETFRVLRATLSIERMGEPPQGPFYSELWMWQNGGELLKLRVTGPAGNPSTTALKAREFADSVDFAR